MKNGGRRFALSTPFNLTSNNFRSLYTSKAKTLHWLAGNIFESPNGLGRGRATSTALQESYRRRVIGKITDSVPQDMLDWAKRQDKTWARTGVGINQEGIAAFNREVMLELNDRALGRVLTRDPAVTRAADAYEAAGTEALDVLKGKPGQIASRRYGRRA